MEVFAPSSGGWEGGTGKEGNTVCLTVEPPNKGHFGNGSFVLSSEVVPISEVHRILIYYIFISSIKMFKMGR